MAELDTASIVLLVLAVLIAPWVLPALLRIMAAEKEALDDHAERAAQDSPRRK